MGRAAPAVQLVRIKLNLKPNIMKIMCQEHYDKVVQYAESIGDRTLKECLQRLELRERNPRHPCQIELYRDFAPYSFLFKERYPDGSLGVVGGLFTTAARIGRAVLLTAPFTAGRPTPEKSKSESSIPAEAINPAGILFYY